MRAANGTKHLIASGVSVMMEKCVAETVDDGACVSSTVSVTDSNLQVIMS